MVFGIYVLLNGEWACVFLCGGGLPYVNPQNTNVFSN